MNPATEKKRRRWWPVVAILLIAGFILIWTWSTGEEQTRQDRVYRTALVALVGFLLLLFWFFLLSRFSSRIRLMGMVFLVAVGLLLSLLFRFAGVSGDMVPLLEWRWARVSGDSAEEVESVDTTRRLRPAVGSADFPQFRGPTRNGTLPAMPLDTNWENNPPRLLWRRPIGEAWSSFAVRDGVAVTLEQIEEQERVTAYDLYSGEAVWSHSYPARYANPVSGTGPRSTPTIDGSQVFITGATGILSCLDFRDGKLLWSRDVMTEHGAEVPVWGYSCSPLVVEDRVIVSAGGPSQRSLVAYDRSDGSLLWGAGPAAASYSSPILAELAGRWQVIILTHSSLVAHDPNDGRLLWQHPWSRSQPNVSQPVVLPGNRVLASTGYGVGSKLFQIEQDADGQVAARLLWESPRLKAKFTNVVYYEGFLYGLDDGVLVCLDPATGQRRWKRGRYGHGQVLLIGDLLLVQTEQGEIVLVEPNPQQHRELSRFAALSGKTWNPPVVVKDLLLVRNHREAACYQLPLIESTGQ